MIQHAAKRLKVRPRTSGPAVSVVGLGKLGAPMAACYASMGCRVIGLDLDASKVEAVNRGLPPVIEPDLDRLMAESAGRFTATQDWNEAIGGSEITFVIVPTPSEPNGRFTATYAVDAMRSIGQALREKNTYHLVVLCSTVVPGTMDREVRPALEEAAGKPCGEAMGLCYSPRFIALGTVVHDFLNPDLVLVGESDERSGEALERFYGGVHENKPPIARMSYANAELAKLAVNTFVTTKISFANMLTAMCEALPGGDVDAVTAALGIDSRIGPKTLKGGLGYGGPCFPRDNLALSYLGRELGVAAAIAEATDTINRGQIDRLLTLVRRHRPAEAAVGILGLSYKPGTSIIEESQGVALARTLAAEGIPVVVYDPMAMDEAEAALGGTGVAFAETMEACAARAGLLAVMTPWPEFEALGPGMLRPGTPKPVVIDCWRALDQERLAGAAEYIALGIGPNV